MKRNDFKLLVENWRKNLVLEMDSGDHDDDIYASFDSEDDHPVDEMHVDNFEDEVGDNRHALLQRFCDMMGIECEPSEIENFLAGQALDAGYSTEGEDLDDSEIH